MADGMSWTKLTRVIRARDAAVAPGSETVVLGEYLERRAAAEGAEQVLTRGEVEYWMAIYDHLETHGDTEWEALQRIGDAACDAAEGTP